MMGSYYMKMGYFFNKVRANSAPYTFFWLTLYSENTPLFVFKSWADLDNKFYEQVTDLKSKNLKVLLALGGWNDSAGSKYSRLVNNAAARARFVEHAVRFLKEHNFDGLHLDWEYPKCWQVNIRLCT